MNKTIAKLNFLMAALTAVAMILSGCAAVAVGGAAAGTVAYVKGDLESTVDAPLTNTIAAVDSAIYYLRLLKVGQEQVTPVGKDHEVTRITVRDPDDKKVTIRLSPVNRNITHISIRVGTFGNEARAQAILAEIKRSLVW